MAEKLRETARAKADICALGTKRHVYMCTRRARAIYAQRVKKKKKKKKKKEREKQSLKYDTRGLYGGGDFDDEMRGSWSLAKWAFVL